MRFKPAKDSLMRAATRTRYPGSSKTRVAHLKEVNQFVKELRNQGLGVKKWDNVTNKHVGAVVKSWQDRGLAAKTIKEYLSGVRATAVAYGNNSSDMSSSPLTVGQRVEAGSCVGNIGQTGLSGGPHLDVMIYNETH